MSIRHAVLSTAAAITLFSATHARAASIADTLASDPRFSHLLEVVQQAGLTGSLQSSTKVIMFAPVNDAFDKMSPLVLQALLPNNAAQQQTPRPGQLQALVRGHIVDGNYDFAAAGAQPVTVPDEAGTNLIVQMAAGGGLAVTSQPPIVGGPDIGGLTTPRTANQVGPAIITDNGIVIPVDDVLIP